MLLHRRKVDNSVSVQIVFAEHKVVVAVKRIEIEKRRIIFVNVVAGVYQLICRRYTDNLQWLYTKLLSVLS